MAAAQDLIELGDPRATDGSDPGADPEGRSLPIRWSSDHIGGMTDGVIGGVDDVVRADEAFDGRASEPEPDAGARGWVAAAGEPRSDALFVLAGPTLGIGRGEQAGPPLWLDLQQLVNLDAIGDPVAGPSGDLLQEVELVMEDRTNLRAGWTLAFCDQVVSTLERLAGRTTAEPAPTPSTGPDVRFEEVSETPTPAPNPTAFSTGPSTQDAAPPQVAPAETAPAAPSAPPRDAAPPAPAPQTTPAPQTIADASPPRARPTPHVPVGALRSDAPRSGTLELEDVVYLGGYPGHAKKRRKCTATLGRAGLEVAGPGDLHFRISWDVVRTIEVQNADEARFRMNAKIHRDASALVIECDQSVTILLEARDCPTIALRSAIGQLLTDMPVVVV